MSSESAHLPRGFPTTSWPGICTASQAGGEDQLQALDALLRKYLSPLKHHVVVKFGLPVDRAEDMVQGFVLRRILVNELLGRAKQTRGRFRTFLLNSLDNFICNELRGEQALKRAPTNGLVSFEEAPERELIAGHEPPETSFDAAWAQSVMRQALERMQAECEKSGRQDIWEVFNLRLLKPALEEIEPMAYEQLVERFQFQSPAQAHNTLATGKRMFLREIREVIAEYAPVPEEIDQELDNWRRAFGKISGSIV